jgi:hypothetical protein
MTTIGNESRPAYVYDAETDTWIPIGVGPHTHDEYIDKTIITAKGDIIVGTALDAVAKLGVGTTGQVLVVNPSTATGLEWANPTTISVTSPITNSGTSTSANIGINQSLISIAQSQVTDLTTDLAGKSPLAGSTSITTVGTVTTATSPTAAGSTGLRKITISTAAPSGGADGDVWLRYV